MLNFLIGLLGMVWLWKSELVGKVNVGLVVCM